MTKEVLTYSPYAGAIFDGDVTKMDMTYSEFIGNRILAEVGVEQQMVASKKTLESVHQSMSVTKPKFSFQLSASMRKQARQIAAAKELKKAVWSGQATPQQIMLYQQMSASVDSRVEKVRTIPLIPTLLGDLPEIYILEQGFTGINVEKLDAKVPEKDSIEVQLQLNPGQKAETDRTNFADHRFSLKRNSCDLLWTTESGMRSDFDLKQIDVANVQTAMRRGRDLLSLLELSKCSTAGSYTIRDPTAANTAGFPNSKYNVVEDMAKIIADFNTQQSAMLSDLFWNSVDFVLWSSSYYTTGFVPSPDYAGYGIVATPKIPGVRSIVSPMVPRGFVYAVDRSASFRAEGPKATEMERDGSVYSDVGYFHDFVQFKIANPARFTAKITIDGVTPGTEITTLAQARKLTKAPVTLASD